MIAGRLVLMGLALFGSHIDSAKRFEAKPSWTLRLNGPYFRDRVVSEMPEMNRSCGVFSWDETHVLIYFMTSTEHLALRNSGEVQASNWSISVQIVRTDDGVVEQSASIPADTFMSELVVVAGGIVVSNLDHLTFYSRDLTRIDPVFTYRPLHIPKSTIHGLIGDPEHLYVTADGKVFLLVDSSAHQSHFFQFGGVAFTEQRDWTLAGADPQSISIKGEKIIYGRLIIGDQMSSASWWTIIDGESGTPKVFSRVSDDLICQVPIAVEVRKFLDMCGSIRIVGERGSEILYQPQKHEVIGALIHVSSDKRLAALVKHDIRGGGALDLTEHRIGTGLLIVNLRAEHHICEIPLTPMPHSQLAFTFASTSTLIVLNDGMVNAYRSPCPND
jgi:hypothetical protein